MVARRNFVKAIPLLAFGLSLRAEAAASTIAVRKLHSFGLLVTDLDRSVQFYQDVLGAPVQTRDADSVTLRIGHGPQFFSLTATRPGQRPGISHIGLSVADFELQRVQSQLAEHGIQPGGRAPLAQPPEPLRSWVNSRPSANGTRIRQLYFADADGVVYQLLPEPLRGDPVPLDSAYGDRKTGVPAGLFEAVDINHFTNFVANRDASNRFFMGLFDKRYQAFQGPTAPIIGLGDGQQFLMYAKGPPRPENAAGFIHHVCLAIRDFSVDDIQAKLEDYGFTGGGKFFGTLPLTYRVSLRMPERGGAEGGTPEVYFFDPDGIPVQLQDTSYCGGGGYLGELCEPIP